MVGKGGETGGEEEWEEGVVVGKGGETEGEELEETEMAVGVEEEEPRGEKGVEVGMDKGAGRAGGGEAGRLVSQEEGTPLPAGKRAAPAHVKGR